MQSLKFSNNGFVFVLEVIIALVIFASFLQVSFYAPNSTENPLQKTELKQLTNSIVSFLDYNGFMLSSLDSSLSDQEKMDLVHETLSGYIPSSYEFRIELSAFDGNRDSCIVTEDFEDCFLKNSSFPSVGGIIPTDKSYSFDRYYFLSKGSPQQCSIGAIFAPYNETKLEKLFFSSSKSSSKKIQKLFFADNQDLNIEFGVNVTPQGEVECDQTIHADLNAHIVVPGRAPADIMLVQDRSGSMSWDGIIDFSSSQDIVVDGNYAYVADGSSGLRIANISSPSSPTLSSTYNTSDYANGVYVDGDYAFVTDQDDGMDIINISNKSSPSLSGNIGGIGRTEKVFVDGDYAYVVTSTDGEGSLSFEINSSRNTQTYVGRRNYTWAAQSFVATTDSISRIDLYMRRTGSRPSQSLDVIIRSSLQGADLASTSISRYSFGTSYAWETANFSSPVSLTVGQTYYVVLETGNINSSRYYYWGGNSSNPYAGGTAYQETSQLATTDTFMRFYSSIPRGLQIIDVSNKSSPNYLTSISGDDPMDIFVEGSYAYLTDGSNGLKIIDISTPESAIQVGSVDTTDATGLFVEGDYAYVADRGSGLQIIDISNKSSPFIETTYNTPGSAWDVFVYSDGNAYVADDSSFQIIDVSSPTSPTFVNSYLTPYGYEKLYVLDDWAFLNPGYGSGMTTFNIYAGPKMNQSKRAGIDFIDQAQWKEGDSIGLVSFSSSDVTDQTLLLVDDANRLILQNKLNNLVADGGTAMGDAIYAATTELNSSRTNPTDYKFQILLSDGQSNSGSSPITAAQNAASNGIKIFTIGFGGDADTSTLESIADITDANFFFAEDENALQNVYDLIAVEIGEILEGAGAGKAFDSNVMIPLISCDYVTDPGAGSCVQIGDQNYLYYDIGYLDRYTDWNGYFEMVIPCNVTNACEITTLTVPFEGTFFYWKDINGILKDPIQWDTNIELNFKYRDLSLEIISASIIGPRQLLLDVNAKNIGLLSSPTTTIDFYLNDPVSGTFLKQINVQPLNAGENIIYLDEDIDEEGNIYVIINRTGVIAECPGNNTTSVSCFDAPRTRYYVMDLWVWKK